MMEAAVLPPELVCPICSCLLEDAVMMPCCAGTACDPCARAGGGTCPVCGEVASTEELIPYRLFRDKVDKFCSQTEYARARPPQHHHQPSRPSKPSLPDIVLPTLQSHRPTGSSVTDSPRGTSPPRPQTPTPSPPRSPGTPLSYPERRSPSPATPHSHQNKVHGRGTPTTSPEFISNPKPPGPTLLPPVHVLAPSSHWLPSPPHPSAPVQVVLPPTFLHPTEDPLAAFEAAMRKLDSKKASRGRHGQASPPRAYREERTRSRSRERLRDRERDYSSRRKSPGGNRNCSPRVREGVPFKGPSYLAASTNDQTGSRSNFWNEGKIRDVQGDSVELTWSRPRRERYVTDIPPETREERRDRERFERNLAKRMTGSYRSRTEIRCRAAPNFEYQEREGTENKARNVDSRTPSLSPEPEGKYEFGRRGEVVRGYRQDTMEMEDKRAANTEKMSEKRDEENCETNFKKEEEYSKSGYQDHKNLELSQSDGSYYRGGERELRGYEEHCEDDAKYKDEYQGGMNKPRKGEEMQDEKRKSSGEDLVYAMKSESKGKLAVEPEEEESINGSVKRELSNEDEAEVYKGGKRLDDKILNAAAKQRSEEVEQEKASPVEKVHKKVKKSKKSKKNKSKDKELRKSIKESRKRKKHKKRGNDIDEEPEEDVKSLVPYDEGEDTKTDDSSAENQGDNSSVSSNFISSFKETKMESRRANIDLPSLILNYKTEDLAEKKVHSKEREKVILAKLQLYSESLSSSSSKNEVKGHSKGIEMMEKNIATDVQACGSPELLAAPSVSSKWEREDILTAEYPELKHPLVTDPESVPELPKSSVQGSSSGPQNVLRRALANMEKDHLLREKKQKSSEGTKSKKKKKTKKKKSRGENESSEDELRLKKKRKKKKSGIEIPEKTLKKLLKKNLIRKEALEKMISKEGGKKKRKKKYSDADKGKGRMRQSSSEDETEKKNVKVSKLKCQEGVIVDEGSEKRKGHMMGNKRASSEEGREVQASRGGKIQVRLAIRESSDLVPGKKSLASTVQANLLKMASQDSSGRGERGRRESPERRSVKDRLGPVRREHSSPVRRSSLRENDRSSYNLYDDRLTRFEGRNTIGRDTYESKKGEASGGKERLDVWESGGLEPVPAKLQAWAGRHSPVKQDRDNRRRREKDSSVEKSCKERRRKHGNR